MNYYWSTDPAIKERIENMSRQEDIDPDLQFCIEQVADDLDDWERKTKVKIANHLRYQNFSTAILAIIEIFKMTGVLAEIDCKVKDGRGVLITVAHKLSADKNYTKELAELIGASSSFNISPSIKDGMFRISIEFKLDDYLYVEPDDSDEYPEL